MLVAAHRDGGDVAVTMDRRRESRFTAERRLALHELRVGKDAAIGVHPIEIVIKQRRRGRAIAFGQSGDQRAIGILHVAAHGGHESGTPGTGGVPRVWNDLMVCRPQAWPFLRSASVQVIGFQSGASTSRAPAQATSTRLPPGS